MTRPPEGNGTTNSAWVDGFTAEIRRGKHVLLHGNVYDRCPYDGSYYTIKDMVRTWLAASVGYEIVCEYDPLDRFCFEDQVAASKFADLVNGADGGSPGRATLSTRPASASASRSQLSPPPRISGVPQSATQEAQPSAAFLQLRRAFSQQDTSVACIVDLLDMLPDSPGTSYPTSKVHAGGGDGGPW